MQTASFGRRFTAHMIDLFLIVIVAFVMMLLALIPMILFAFIDDGGFLSLMANNALNVLVYGLIILYFALCESSSMQGTVGKRIMGIMVVDEYGERLTFKKALVRGAVKVLLSSILLIGYLMALFTKDSQSLHDTVAKTYVVKR